jgi:[ribosomal protein S18]-alanine N-acetyltransferase
MSLIELELQPPQTEQLNQVIELDKSCLGGLWTLEGYQRELDSPNSSLLILSLASPHEQIIGCGCFWAILEEAHITLLMVHPDYQGRGLGELLLYALLDDACKRQLERATLEVRVSNEVAISLYKKFGFQVAGRRKGYYQTTGEDALILWRGDLHQPEFVRELETWRERISDRLAQNGWQLK